MFNACKWILTGIVVWMIFNSMLMLYEINFKLDTITERLQDVAVRFDAMAFNFASIPACDQEEDHVRV